MSKLDLRKTSHIPELSISDSESVLSDRSAADSVAISEKHIMDSGDSSGTVGISVKSSKAVRQPRRINIIGPPGSGKTTLARQLAEFYNLPLVHMDLFALSDEFNPMYDKPKFLKKTELECSKPEWVMEGVYKSTFKYRIPLADLTIYLDFSRRIYIYRVFKRRVEYWNIVRAEMPDGWDDKMTWPFFKYVWTFHKKETPHMKTELNKFKNENILIFNHPSKLREYLSTEYK